MTARAALRAADRAEPQARARLALDPRPPARPRARARRPGRPAPEPRRRAVRHEPLRDLPPRLHEPGRPRPPSRCRRTAGGGSPRATTSPPMPAAERRWAVAGRRRRARARPRSALRLWGLRHGLPFVYNADENAHFVAGAIGMFGHTYNPNYFINPPGFTYLLHAAFQLGFGGPRRRVGVLRRRPERRVRARAGAVGRARRDRRRAAGVGGGAAVRPPHRLRGRRAAGGRVPARPLRAPRAQRRADARAAVPRARRRRRRLRARADARLRARRRRARPRLRDEVHGRDRAAAAAGGGARSAPRAALRRRLGGLALAGVLALGGFLLANPFALLDFDAFRDGLERAVGGVERRRRQARADREQRDRSTTSGPRPGASAGCRRSRRSAGRSCSRCATGGARSCWCPPLVVFVLFMGTPGPLLRALAAAALPARCAAGRLRRARRRSAWLRRPRARRGRGRAGVLLCAQGLVFAIHNDVVLARDDTRQLARDWMVENVPAGTKVVIEPVMPDSWASDPGRALRGTTGNGARWAKWPTSRSRLNPDGTLRKGGLGPIVKLEDYERTLFPQLVEPVRRPRLLHGADRLDPVRARAGRARGRPAGDPATTTSSSARAASCSREPQPVRRRSRSTSRSTPTRCRSTAPGRRS